MRFALWFPDPAAPLSGGRGGATALACGAVGDLLVVTAANGRAFSLDPLGEDLGGGSDVSGELVKPRTAGGVEPPSLMKGLSSTGTRTRISTSHRAQFFAPAPRCRTAQVRVATPNGGLLPVALVA